MLWLEHISPEQLQMGIAVCSLLTVLLLIVTLHKINRIQRYIQKNVALRTKRKIFSYKIQKPLLKRNLKKDA